MASQKDKRIIIINNNKNLGLTKSLNKGLKIANGRYIARMDADDISFPTRFQKQYDFLETHRNIFLIGTACYLINEKGRTIGSREMETNVENISKTLTKSNCFIHPSIFFRNTNSLFYREKMWYVEDYDLYLNLLSDNKKMSNLKEKLISYRITPNSICRTKRKKQLKFVRLAVKFYNQRMHTKKDEYELFDPNVILKSINITDIDNKNAFLKDLTETHFKNGNFKEVRIIIRNHRKKHQKLFLKFIPYELCSYCPFVYTLYRFIFYNEKSK